METPEIEYEVASDDDAPPEHVDDEDDDNWHLCWCRPHVEEVHNDRGELVGEIVVHRGFED